MKENTIINVLLAVLVGLLIHILFSAYKKENMEVEISNEQQINIRGEPTDIAQDDITISGYHQDSSLETQMSVDNFIGDISLDGGNLYYDVYNNKNTTDHDAFLINRDRGIIGKTPLEGCAFQAKPEDKTQFVNNYSLWEKDTCEKDKPKYTRSDMKENLNNTIDFRNKVNFSSHQDDAVDKINTLILNGQGTIGDDNQGMRIRDLYDTLTSGVDLYTNKCVRNQGNYNLGKTSGYTLPKHNGKYFTEDKWAYGHERVINGGSFYNNIHPNNDDNKLSVYE
jgi:hypothetical protein